MQAVASMASDDKEPRSVMSRGKSDGQVVHGARMVRHRRWTSPHRATWPAPPEESRPSESEVQPAPKRQRKPRAAKEKAVRTVSGTALMAAAASTSSPHPGHASYHGTPKAGIHVGQSGYMDGSCHDGDYGQG